MGTSSDNPGFAAFREAVIQYKPWHQLHWDSKGTDSFPQLINGGLKHGVFNLKTGAEIFGTTPDIVKQWADGAIPDRKVRGKVWRALRNKCGISKSELPRHRFQ